MLEKARVKSIKQWRMCFLATKVCLKVILIHLNKFSLTIVVANIS